MSSQPNGKSKLTRLRRQCLKNTGQQFIGLQTLDNSPPIQSKTIESISSPGDFLARIYQSPEVEEDWPASAPVFGGKCSAYFPSYVRDSSSSKTSRSLSLLDSAKFSEVLPNSGMMRNGRVCPLDNLGPCITENGFSLLPTPQASDGMQGAISSKWSNVVPDSRGFPRRIHVASGGTFSIGLARITQASVFQPLIPQLAEELMGFPIEWSDCTLLEMQLSLVSQNGSGKGLFKQ